MICKIIKKISKYNAFIYFFLYNKIGEVMDSQIIKVVGIIVSLITVVTPIIKLNTSITKLSMNVNILTTKVQELTLKSSDLEQRVITLESNRKDSGKCGINNT